METPKHPRLVRWTHWLNVPFLGLMVWSGLKIYWSNRVYVELPDRFYSLLGLDYSLARGMAVHFFVGWLFALNGLVYAAYTALSGEWRQLVPEKKSWLDSWRVVLHDLHLLEQAPPQGRYNAAQRIAYTAAVIMGAGMVLTGLAMFKPVQLSPLTRLLGGYRLARREHFWLMIALLAFIAVHFAQVARAGWRNLRSMAAGLTDSASGPAASRVTRRALLTGGAGALLGTSAWAWILSRPELEGEVWPLRKVLRANDRLWRALFRPSCRAPEGAAVARGHAARQNGDLGLEDDIDLAAWRLSVLGAGGVSQTLRLADIKALPRVELTTDLNCVEGWSDRIAFAGARFSDLMERYALPLTRFAGLETPDRGYYVSLDIETMMHLQTLLVYEMNGEPLTGDHGAPLRLFTPLKYGIKSLKRIGKIFFSDVRPPDYWEEQGYDWYAGL